MTALSWTWMADDTMRHNVDLSSDTDRQQIEAARGGDGDAFARLVRRHQQAVARRLWRFTRDRTVLDELVQETFVQAWMSLASYRGEAPFLHWLMRIATRAGYRHWKLQARHAAHHEQKPVEFEAARTPSSSAESAEYVTYLLSLLPPRDRLVLTLTAIEGCNIEEASQQIGWSQSMVKVQAHRARAKLRKLLEQLEK